MSDTTTTETQQPDGGGTQTTQTTTTETGDKGAVPYARFAEVLSEKNHFKKQLEELNTKLQAHEGNATKLSKLEKDFEAAKTTWAEERAFIAAGITDAEAMEVARLFYARLETKPEGGIGAWLTEIKADPSKAPKALSAYLASGEQTQQARAATTTTVRQTGRQQPAGEAVTAEAMRAAREKAMRTGDWTEFKTLDAAFKASMQNG